MGRLGLRADQRLQTVFATPRLAVTAVLLGCAATPAPPPSGTTPSSGTTYKTRYQMLRFLEPGQFLLAYRARRLHTSVLSKPPRTT